MTEENEKKESNILEEEEEIVQEQRFQEQCFLMDFWEIFAKSNKNIDGKPKTYSNFVSVLGEPGVILSQIHGPGIKDIFNITNDQLALLQPKIRLFKSVYFDGKFLGDVEFQFSDFYDETKINSITRSRAQRGAGVGLKKFDWEDMGTNPGDTGKAFQATLLLHAQTIDDLFEEQTSFIKGQPVSAMFADLIRVPPKQFVQTSLGNLYNDKFFRIKVKVGWSYPSTISDQFLPRKVKEAIDRMETTLFLNLTVHNITFNENGTIELSAEYIGAIEGMLLSADSDIFYIDKQASQEVYNQNVQIKGAETRLKDLNAKVPERRGVIKTDKNSWGITRFLQTAEREVRDHFVSTRISDEQLELEALEQDKEIRIERKANIIAESKAKAYSRLLKKLEQENRLFYVDVDKKYLDLLGETAGGDQLSQGFAAHQRGLRLQDFRENSKKAQFQVQSHSSANSSKVLLDAITKVAQEKDTEAREEIINAADVKLTRAEVAKKPDVKRVNFMYFGDLINAALGVIYDKYDNDKNENEEHFRFLLGPIELVNPITKEKTILSLADVPISLNLFQAWFLKNVIKVQKEKYLVKDFLRDITSQLIVRALGPSCFGDAYKGASNRVSFSIFSLPTRDSDPFCPKASSGGRFGGNRIEVNTSKMLKLKRGNTDPEQMRHYLLIYVSSYTPNTLVGDYQKDTENGIYHLYIGADQGIAKQFSFERSAVQYIKESRIANAEGVEKGSIFLSEPYNVTIAMNGNSVFKPGMLVFVDPASVGMGKSIDKTKRLPLGGYYNIIKVFNEAGPGLYNTKIDCTWVSDPYGEDASKGNIPSNSSSRERSIDSP